jgi:hypothetical protein
MSTLLTCLATLMHAQRTRTVPACVDVRESTHLVLCNDSGRVLGLQRSVTMQGRTFSAAIEQVIA